MVSGASGGFRANMGRATRCIVVGCLLTVGVPGTIVSQPLSPTIPSLKEVEVAWAGFWSAVMAGDLMEARKYIHSRRRHLFPGPSSLEELQEVAQQMAFCRLEPLLVPPTLLNPETERQLGLTEEEIEKIRRGPPGQLEALLGETSYSVRCQHGSETAEALVGLRRDWDGVWRFSTL